MEYLLRIWNHKQKIAGAVTGIVSILGGAGVIGAQTALHVTALTGAVTMAFAILVDVLKDDPDDK